MIVPTIGILKYRLLLIQMSNEQIKAELNSNLSLAYRMAAEAELKVREDEEINEGEL